MREDNARTGFFEPEQYDRVVARLPSALRPVVEFAYITGWRIASEVLPLEWRQIDFQSGEIRLDIPDEEPRGAVRDYDVMIVEDIGDPDHRRPATIAPKYLDAAKGRLKVTVQPNGKNEFEFKLDAP